MLKNYLITAWRNITRHKMLAAINIFGLSLGISACLIIFLITRFELSFDNYHPGKERIFRIVSDHYSTEQGEDHSGNIPLPAPTAIRNEIGGIEALAVFHSDYLATITIRDSGLPEKRYAKPPFGDEQHSDMVLAEPSYFDLFHYDWLAGNAAVLKEPYTVVLTESKARQYFGAHAPADYLNKTILYNDSLNIRVAGIVKDPGKNTDFHFKDFISFCTLNKDAASASWNDGYATAQVYVKLASNVPASQINALLANIRKKHYPQTAADKTTWTLQPLSTIHFDARYTDTYSRKVHLPTLYGLMGIALFILVMAVINFITLSTAQSIDRAKETGIRKICGSTGRGLITRFLGETAILTGLALILAIGGIYPLLAVFRSFIPEGVDISIFSLSTWLFLLGLGLLTTLLAGLYPGRILSAAKPAAILKGAGMQKGNKGGYLIKGLIVFQFTISIVFIIGVLVAVNQMHYMMNKDLGFTQDAILTVQTNPDYGADKKVVLAEKIRQLPGVQAVSLSEGTPVAKLHFFNPLIYKGKEERGAACILEWGDEHFAPLYDIRIIAGRNIEPSDTIKEFLVNESCAKALGFATPEEAIGKMVETMMPGQAVKRPIIGVMADFHSQSLHEAIKPVFLTTAKEFTRLISIRLNTPGKQVGSFKNTVANIEKSWKVVYPHEPFDYAFFDETIGRFYEKEQQMARLLNIALIVSISISCLGLFGLATLTARRRTKEIGIRKVLGAGIGQIVYVLTRDTIKLVLIAIAVASPIGWYMMNQWLHGFAFRIGIPWWIFVLAGAIVFFIAFCTICYQSIKAAFVNPVATLRRD
jgi:ABC-type antimicrobial peptide transport system permease subunit